jgi:hypothetical protein
MHGKRRNALHFKQKIRIALPLLNIGERLHHEEIFDKAQKKQCCFFAPTD